MVVHTALGAGEIEIRSLQGHTFARHRRHPQGAGAIVGLPEHRAELEAALLHAFTTAPPCRRKPNDRPRRPRFASPRRSAGATRPTAARKRSGWHQNTGEATRRSGSTVDLARYAELVER